jgi:hypothetical protein
LGGNEENQGVSRRSKRAGAKSSKTISKEVLYGSEAWEEKMNQRHELVDECLAPIQCASAVVGFDLAGVNTKYLQYRLALEALRLAEAERIKHRRRAVGASLEERLSALKAGLEDLLPDDSEAALPA